MSEQIEYPVASCPYKNFLHKRYFCGLACLAEAQDYRRRLRYVVDEITMTASGDWLYNGSYIRCTIGPPIRITSVYKGTIKLGGPGAFRPIKSSQIAVSAVLEGIPMEEVENG